MAVIVPRTLAFRLERVFLFSLLILTSICAALDLKLIVMKPSSEYYGPAGLRIAVFLLDVLSVTICTAGLCFLRVNFLWAFIALDSVNFLMSLILSMMTTFWWGTVSLGFSVLSWIFAFCIIREINLVRNAMRRGEIQIALTDSV
jgi:hypothetical protein